MQHIIIGANFGDEGKGLVTDALATPDSLNVRFNGGAQAGHTVVDAGLRHVFSHFGSGTFRRATTVLTPEFLVNPMLFVQELRRLLERGATPQVFVDPKCRVTTPYDMILNEAVEEARGNRRHGSVGVGINETVVRSERSAYQLTVSDLCDGVRRRAMLYKIQKQWLPVRTQELGLVLSERHRKLALSEDVFEHWQGDARTFIERVFTMDTARLIQIAAADDKPIVFEGAQGLGLDELHGTFPYVTRSRTGVHNAIKYLAKRNDLELIYITRAYLTRHGPGPVPHETKDPPFEGIRDDTNVRNPYQGSLRYALLDLDDVASRVARDLLDFPFPYARVSAAVTCLDQLPEQLQWRNKGVLFTGRRDEFLHAVCERVPVDRLYYSTGPNREHFTSF